MNLGSEALTTTGHQHVWIPSGPEQLATSIDVPDSGTKQCPCVIMVHGFTGCRLGRSYHFVEFGRKLAAAGIACIRFDQAGCGESTGPQSAYSLKSIERDCLSVFDWMNDDGRFDMTRIGLVGSSMGALGAVMLEAQRLVHCMTLWGPVHDLPGLVQQRKGEAETVSVFKTLGYVPYKGIRLGREYFDHMHLADPARRIASNEVSSAPVLILHAAGDEVVSFEHSQAYLDAYRGAGRVAELLELDDDSHDFFEDPARSHVLNSSCTWFVQHLADADSETVRRVG
ncbi:MAG: alpha/beta fold hydrolase [Planctomycetes bacterium]|nr:alpha/beta fold hydrolase [Planctomycetota bacterium]NOG55892.1 alpha/beta fold hydrolase [Planctomycetota bacterium]